VIPAAVPAVDGVASHHGDPANRRADPRRREPSMTIATRRTKGAARWSLEVLGSALHRARRRDCGSCPCGFNSGGRRETFRETSTELGLPVRLSDRDQGIMHPIQAWRPSTVRPSTARLRSAMPVIEVLRLGDQVEDIDRSRGAAATTASAAVSRSFPVGRCADLPRRR
jgi:hypothetical protein